MDIQTITIRKAENGCTVSVCSNKEGYSETNYVDDGSVIEKVLKHLGIEEKEEVKTFNAKAFLGEKN